MTMDKQQREKVMDKVRKLLALATSPNVEEADTAMKMVGEILAKYDMEMSEVEAKTTDTDDVVDQLLLDSYFDTDVMKRWESELVLVISRTFDCNVLRTGRSGKKQWIFIGFKYDLNTTQYFLCYIRRAIGIGSMSFKKKIDQDTYSMGFVNAIKPRLEILTKAKAKVVEENSCTAMVLAKKQAVDMKLKELYPRLQKGHSSSSALNGSREAWMAGENAGKNLTLGRPVSSGASRENIGSGQKAIA